MVESLLVLINGWVGVLTFGEPTGLELPEVEVPGSGRLLPTVGETLGGVTDDITMVGVVMDDSRVKFLLSTTVAAFGSIVTVVDVVTAVVVDDTVVVVVVVDVFDSLLVVTDVLPSILLDRSPLSMELRASKCSLKNKKIISVGLMENTVVRIFHQSFLLTYFYIIKF